MTTPLTDQHRQLVASTPFDDRSHLTEVEDRMDYGDRIVEDHEMCSAVLQESGKFTAEIRMPNMHGWVHDDTRWDTLLEALVWADLWLDHEETLDNATHI